MGACVTIAENSTGKKVFVDAYDGSEKLFCTLCHNEVIPARGKIRIHHFRHKNVEKCPFAHNYEEMTEWHLAHQKCFPIECREVVIKHADDLFRADVCIDYGEIRSSKARLFSSSELYEDWSFEDSKGIVIEFQHSRISQKDFDERNRFYTDAGYHICWVFDARDALLEEDFQFDEAGREHGWYLWKNPIGTLVGLDWWDSFYDGKLTIFLELSDQKYLRVTSSDKNIYRGKITINGNYIPYRRIEFESGYIGVSEEEIGTDSILNDVREKEQHRQIQAELVRNRNALDRKQREDKANKEKIRKEESDALWKEFQEEFQKEDWSRSTVELCDPDNNFWYQCEKCKKKDKEKKFWKHGTGRMGICYACKGRNTELGKLIPCHSCGACPPKDITFRKRKCDGKEYYICPKCNTPNVMF